MMRFNRQRGAVGGVFYEEVRIHSSRCSSSSLARAPQSAALAAPAPDHVLAVEESLHSFIIKSLDQKCVARLTINISELTQVMSE